jgi:hypothetical protein
MKTKIKTIQYTLPAYWASALINGDESGLEQEEQDTLGAFIEYMLQEHGACHCVDCTEEPVFSKYHEARPFGVLACDCLDYTFHVRA